jgi:hypothetical protein
LVQVEVLRNRNGSIIGKIEHYGQTQILRDRNGSKLGTYDARENATRDRNGSKVGSGNLLLTLLR